MLFIDKCINLELKQKNMEVINLLENFSKFVSFPTGMFIYY